MLWWLVGDVCGFGDWFAICAGLSAGLCFVHPCLSVLLFFFVLLFQGAFAIGPRTHQDAHGSHHASAIDFGRSLFHSRGWDIYATKLIFSRYQPTLHRPSTQDLNVCCVGNILTTGGRAPKRPNPPKHPPQAKLTPQTTGQLQKHAPGHTQTSHTPHGTHLTHAGVAAGW